MFYDYNTRPLKQHINKAFKGQTTWNRLALNYFLLLLLSLTSCKKLVDISSPPDQLTDDNVYNNDGSAIGVLTGIYTNMSNQGIFTGNASISLLAGLSADELTLYDDVTSKMHIGYYENALTMSPAIGSEFWGPLYNYVYRCNAALDGLESSRTITPSVKQQLIGEAKFLRAFYNFYLSNLFGDVPLPTTTDYKFNSQLSRTPLSEVYDQVITDLIAAHDVLSAEYLDENLQPYVGRAERVRPSRWAAAAMLARAYLYKGDYVNAEAEASAVINQSSLFNLTSLSESFKMNSSEAIWQLQPVVVGHNTEDALTFVIPESGPSDINGPFGNPVYISTQLLNSFEIGDQRRSEWVDSVSVTGTTYYFPVKYRSAAFDDPITEYLMVLRLAEQYLIRAEARVYQNNFQGAREDLDAVRSRAGLSAITADDQPSLLSAISHERQVELFTEWGHRWLDLKRTSNLNVTMESITPLKANGSQWQSHQQWYPVSLDEIEQAPNLQPTEGY